jgi:hypothetical protein
VRSIAGVRDTRFSNDSTRKGESAKSMDRSQLQNLLTFCRLNKGRLHFVVVFNRTRSARDKYDHFALRLAPAIA